MGRRKLIVSMIACGVLLAGAVLPVMAKTKKERLASSDITGKAKKAATTTTSKPASRPASRPAASRPASGPSSHPTSFPSSMPSSRPSDGPGHGGPGHGGPPPSTTQSST